MVQLYDLLPEPAINESRQGVIGDILLTPA